MRLLDISLTVSPQMPTYKGKKEMKPVIEKTRSLEEGANESRFIFPSHTGTHIDAPRHMIDQGKTIDQIPLDRFWGPAVVIEILGRPAIDRDALLPFSSFILKDHYLILKTDNSLTNLSREDFVYLTESGAQFLKEKEIRGLGMDSIGIERNQPDHPSHRTLLASGIVIVEGLYLTHVLPGMYLFFALPLKIEGGDGSPARALLLTW